MTIVYTGTERSRVNQIKKSGLPVGSFVTTQPYVADYYAKKTHRRGVVVALNIPNVERYSRVTDTYKYKNAKSLELTRKPPRQLFLGLIRTLERF